MRRSLALLVVGLLAAVMGLIATNKIGGSVSDVTVGQTLRLAGHPDRK